MIRRRDWRLPTIIVGSMVAAITIGVLVYVFATEERPGPGGSYIEGIAGSPMSLNPLLASFNDPDKDITALLFTGLTRLGQDGTVLPDLADRWQISADGLTYSFHLRNNAKWHDGAPVRPEDAVFTFRLVQDPALQANPEIAALWQQIKIDKANDETVRFILEQPFAPFLTYTSMGLLPQHLLQEVPPQDMAGASFNANPIGAGPFRMKEAAIDQIVVEANPEEHFGRPLLDSIAFRFLRDDQTLAAALSVGRVEGGLLRSSVGKASIERVRQNLDLVLRDTPRSSYSLLFLNTRSPLFQDKIVRQALAYSIDHEGLVEQIVGGLGVVATTPITPNSWAYDPNIQQYPYLPDRASQLLDENGWKMNGAGIREKDGRTMKFSLLTNDDKLRIALGEELVRTLRKVGVQADLEASGPTGLTQDFLIPRNYDVILYGIDPGYDPDPYPLWHSSQATGEGLNVAAFSHPDIDRLLEKGRLSTDLEERKQLYGQFQDLFAEEVPSILLYHPLYTYAMHRRIKGVSVGVLYDTSSRFFNVRDWYSETPRVWGRSSARP